MALKTSKTNYFRLFICDSFPFLAGKAMIYVTDWTTNMDDISVATDDKELAKRLKDANAIQFDQIAGIGLQKDPTLTADPAGSEGNRGIPALKINCNFKVIDPTNTEWDYLKTLQNTRKVAVLVDTQNKLYTDGGLLQFKLKLNQVGNTIEDIEVFGELADGGTYDDNINRHKTLFPV